MRSLTQPEGKSGVLSYGLYKMFRERFKHADSKCDANVHYPQWLRICKKFNEAKMQSIIEGHIFVMPFRLGSLGVVQYKKRIKFDENGNLIKKGLIPNWGKTMKLWEEMYGKHVRSDYKEYKDKPIVYTTNEHTDGRVFRFHWKKKYAVVKNISAYELKIPYKGRIALNLHINEKPNIQYCTKF